MQRRFQFRSVNKQAFKNCNYFLQEISEVLFAHVLSIVNKIRAASLPKSDSANDVTIRPAILK